MSAQRKTQTSGMRFKNALQRLLPPVVLDALRRLGGRGSDRAIRRYLRGGSLPWSPGYLPYRDEFIARSLADEALLARFRQRDSLPAGYGVGLDERCVEYPWVLAHLPGEAEKLLGAGSALNHEFVLGHSLLRRRTLHILTLAPERVAFWQRGVSYLFHDLREIPIRDGYYDAIACISTLEHVGCDNALYTRGETGGESPAGDFVSAVKEMRRVLKPGGTLLLTIPFGVRRHFGAFEQFDREMLSRTVEAFGDAREKVETFYRYTRDGWSVASVDESAT